MPRVLLGFVALLVGAGCAQPVVFVVDMKTDLAVGVEVHRAVVTLDGAVVAEVELAPGEDYEGGVRLTELETEPGLHRVTVALADEGGAVRLVREMVVTAAEDRVLTFVLARSCLDIACPPVGRPEATTCEAGRCVPPECGPDRPEACPAPECSQDTDCGAASACATPRCDDGACLFVGDDPVCGPQRYCAGADGCVDRPGRTRCRWPSDPDGLQLGEPHAVGGDLAMNDLSPWLSPDGRSLYFSRHAPGNPDILVRTRPDLDAPFGPAEPVEELPSDREERRFETTPDGRFAVLATDRDVLDDVDLYFGTRAQPDGPWVWTRSALLSGVGENDLGPHLAASGLELWFHRSSTIYRSRRASPAGPFEAPEPVMEIASPTQDGSVSLTDDGLVLVLHSNRAGTDDLYYAVRASPDAPFGPPMPIGVLNTPDEQEWVPFLRPDGCELFYVTGPYGSATLRHVRVLP